jgi:hypothetical protein
MFALDFRSLCLFRVGLSLFILFNLGQKAEFLQAHYTDEGVLPRADLLQVLDPWALSAHSLSGESGYQIFLFMIQAIFAVLLLINYQTRISSCFCWLLEISLQNRNPLLLDASDSILSLALLWFIFLPLERKGGETANESPAVYSLGTMGLIIQIFSIYFFSAILKIQSGMWLGVQDGGGILYGLKDVFATPIAGYMAKLPKSVLWVLSLGVLLLELMGPLFYLIFRKNRAVKFIIVMLFILFHLGIGATIGIWRFAIISIILWLPLIPASLVSVQPKESLLSRGGKGLVGSMIVIITMANLFSIGLFPHKLINYLHPALSALNLHQNWSMFTSKAIEESSNYEFMGEGDEGSMNLFDIEGIVGNRQSSRWYNYLNSLYFDKNQQGWERLAHHVCHISSAKRGDSEQIHHVRIFRVGQGHNHNAKKRELGYFNCPTEMKRNGEVEP